MQNCCMISPPSKSDADKSGQALHDQRFHMLEDIARELSGDIVFPTYFDAVLRLRTLLNDPNQSIDGIARAVALEPLVSAKTLQLANSVAFNPDGHQLVDLKSAIMRLGIEITRTTAVAIAMRQLLRSKEMAEFEEWTRLLWDHTMQTAAMARVIATRLTRINPEMAMLAGLVHDLGAFYMLYRASHYEELRARPESTRYLIIRWHESIGLSVLASLGIPEQIVAATADHDRLRPPPERITTLSEVLYVANMLSGSHIDWLGDEETQRPAALVELEEKYADLRPEAEAVVAEMRQQFA